MLRQRYLLASSGSAVLGMLLVLVSELARFEWTRLFGAILISLGGLGLGAYYGLRSRQPRESAGRGPRGWLEVSIVGAMLLGAPVLLALAAALVGVSASPAAEGAHVGLLVAIVFLSMTVVLLGLALRSLVRASRSRSGAVAREAQESR